MMTNLERSFLHSIIASYQNYGSSGPTSTAKLKHPHQWLSDTIYKKLGKGYQMFSVRHDDNNAQEISVIGGYYDKKIDVGIKYNGKIISGVGFKFVTSNYKQNSNNYFENMLGETANLQRGHIAYGSLIVLPSKIRYLGKNTKPMKIEVVTTHNLEKYKRLYNDKDFPHKPQSLGIVFVDIDYESNCVTGLTNIDKMDFTPDIKSFLKNDVCLEKFINIFIALTVCEAAKQ